MHELPKTFSAPRESRRAVCVVAVRGAEMVLPPDRKWAIFTRVWFKAQHRGGGTGLPLSCEARCGLDKGPRSTLDLRDPFDPPL